MTLIRNAPPKPPKGTFLRERKQRQMDADAAEERNKAIVRKRDKTCRWPHCDCGRFKLRLEVAHMVDKSLGGSSEPDNLILLCFEKHQGRPSLHSGDLDIQPQTPAGANGPCDFRKKDDDGRWIVVASERYIGVSVTRGPA